jgi:hypothetical protein
MSADVSTYRVSALLKGMRVMWGTAGPALLAIVANAVVQAGLTYVDAQSGFTLAFLLSLIVSAVAALSLYAVLAACALQSVGPPGPSVMTRVRQNFGTFSVWVLFQWFLVLVAAIIHPFAVLLVAVLTPFLAIAAMDGERNALGANFRALGRHLGRWLVTSVILLIAGVVLYLLAAVNTFFVKGTPASLFFWLAIGVVAWWLLTAWTLVYRKVRRRG